MSEAVAITDEGLLRKTQSIRSKIIDKMTTNGTAIPDDPESIGLLLEVMKDTDRTALSKLKITTDDQNAQQDRLAAMTMVKISQQYGTNNPFEKVVSDGDVSVDSRATGDTALLPKIVPVPGNAEIGVSSENYDSFMAKMEPDEDSDE